MTNFGRRRGGRERKKEKTYSDGKERPIETKHEENEREM